jgi:hypothetical protein
MLPAKLFALASQAGLTFAAWYLTRSDDERRQLQAALWKEVEIFAMGWAKDLSNIAAIAERKYRETVSV